MNFPTEIDECKKFEKNNLTIAVSVLYAKKRIKNNENKFTNHDLESKK